MSQNDPDRVPEGVDLDRPNPARIYDWYLGGTTNWAIDREFGAKAVETFPMVRTLARVGREFLGRGVQFIAKQGVTQFLDLGSGVPTVGNVHEIADSVNADSRCVYVDNEPVAVAHSRVLLEREGDPTRHAVLHGDLRKVEDIWERAMDTGVLNPTQPIGLIMSGVLYFFGPDDDPHGIVARYRDLLPSGSYLLASHMTVDGVPEEGEVKREEVRKQYERSSSQLFVRSKAEVTRFFDGFELVEPGVVWIPEWRPDERPSPATEEYRNNPAASSAFAALGKKA
ncbi:methyltransferase [Prauserella sp. PE36]|uniref:Methyltransferase n=1 Tax=Prauserella endophytica TaxID=1592324 RepID=A0ABY2RZ84_9PSEU|nr:MULTISPECIES: SAM-dependent methyltransferase [Prauserella]RBM15608.1 methyltransferase [Prauserella sp. PE36]TKG66309.1 methyltransferase [Prauserella endophytica]